MTTAFIDEQPETNIAVGAPTTPGDLYSFDNGVRPAVSILGTRGIPARHGGFETFAERLSLHLVSRGWDVTVYCQEDGRGPIVEDLWQGVRRVRIPEHRAGARGTIVFDYKSTRRAVNDPGVVLTLGYNTALFCGLYRRHGKPNVINMDGLEWQRAKWSLPAKAWLYLNERLGCRFGDQLIADHPEISRHLATRAPAAKITTIPYGADLVSSADDRLLDEFGLAGRQYALVIARPEPENSLLEIVRAFSVRRRNKKLVVLGRYEPKLNAYHREVMRAASNEVLFPGAVYERDKVDALRFFAQLYIHGHTVGGTNPALVEALGAGCAVLAHANRFNRWVAGDGAAYFANESECEQQLSLLLNDAQQLVAMRAASIERHLDAFTWNGVLSAYERLLLRQARKSLAV